MKRLTPSEAIGPAFNRTREILFQPFHFGRSWKLAASTYVAVIGTAYIPFCTLGLICFIFWRPNVYGPIRPGHAFLGILGALAFDAFSFWIFTLTSRMQLISFDIAVERAQFVAPAWRKYHPLRWRWAKLKLAITTPLAVLACLPFLFFLFWILRSAPALQAGQQNPLPVVASFLLVYVCFFAGVSLVIVAGGLLTDFVLPSLVLEEVTPGNALRRFQDLFRQEPGSICGYAALKIVLAIVGFIAHYTVSSIVMLFFYFLVIIPAIIGGLALPHITATGHSLGTAGVGIGVAIFVLCFFTIALYVQLFTIGTVTLFLRCYAAYYLGGRYPRLGDLLEPPGQSWWNLQPAPPLDPEPPAIADEPTS
ncbi:DUF7544 domain-containing protein [Terriglobus albidus]|uniref:DUF7544 domain-containing protein n=1 Tax=Terriglobus albidus TaxID=1592106 RepID=UPI0021E0F5CA|nr:hypothetical protein [Terriglobus albidus]